MDIDQLRIFLHLTQSLHFSRTSAELFVSPSRLTRLVQNLERELGARVFERDNRTVRLTPAGESLRGFAQHTLTEWELLSTRVRVESSVLTGRLSVFCSVTASYHFLEALLNRLRASHPEVELQLHTGDAAETIQRIVEEQEDIGIAARPDKLPATLQFKTIGKSRLVFIAPLVDCPLRSRLQSNADLQKEFWNHIPLIVPEAGLARSRINNWFRRQAIKPDIYAQVAGSEAIASMVSLGLGVGVVPELVLQNSPVNKKVEILPIRPELAPFLIGICVLKRKLANPLIRAFWQLVPDK